MYTIKFRDAGAYLRKGEQDLHQEHTYAAVCASAGVEFCSSDSVLEGSCIVRCFHIYVGVTWGLGANARNGHELEDSVQYEGHFLPPTPHGRRQREQLPLQPPSIGVPDQITFESALQEA